MAVFVTFLGVRPSVALNATLVRSSSNFHKSCFVMWLNFCKIMGKRRQLERYFFRRPETSRNSLFAREFSALFECCSASSSCLRVLLALRARCDHVFTSLIKKRSTLHVLPILSARRGCPHCQSQSVTVEGRAVDVALVEFVVFACSTCTASTL